MSPNRAALAACVSLLLVGSAAGASAAASPSAAVRAAVSRYAKAQLTGDASAACALLTAAGQKQLLDSALSTAGTCPALIRANAEILKALPVRLTSITKITTTGHRASAVATYTSPGVPVRYDLVQRNGLWKINRQTYLDGGR
jgi:hypothetical protein